MAGIGEDLARLAALRDQGVLTDAEFQEQKARLLNAGAAGDEPTMPEPKKSKLGKGCLIIVGILVALIILGAVAGGGKQNEVVAPSGDASDTAAAADASSGAATPRLSMEGYNRVHTGMSFAAVTAILGEPTQELSRNEIAGTETVMYSWNGSLGANMNAMFQNGKLVQKAQFGLN